jgi:hypothetical protein
MTAQAGLGRPRGGGGCTRSRLLGGLDIAWLIGLAAAALAYLVLARSWNP